MAVYAAPSLDEGLLARAARELPEEYWPSMEHHEWCDEDSGGSHRFDREWWSSDIAAAIAAEYRRLYHNLHSAYKSHAH